MAGRVIGHNGTSGRAERVSVVLVGSLSSNERADRCANAHTAFVHFGLEKGVLINDAHRVRRHGDPAATDKG